MYLLQYLQLVVFCYHAFSWDNTIIIHKIILYFFFVISYKGIKYDYLDISAMHGLLVKIDIIDRQFPNLSTDCEVKRQELLEKNYADFAINNRKYNIKKSRDQHRTMVMLIIAFLTLFITVAYYFIRYYLTETT